LQDGFTGLMRAILKEEDTEAITQQLNAPGIDVNIVGKVIHNDMQDMEGIYT
jgi:phosphoribosylaminoimidazole (AIR) synthetase